MNNYQNQQGFIPQYQQNAIQYGQPAAQYQQTIPAPVAPASPVPVAPANEEIGWDDEISLDGNEFILLPDGEYNFSVETFERGRFPGSAKISPCNKVTLTLLVSTPDGEAHVITDLILNKKLEWKLSEFFRSIGMKKHGEKVRMDWSKVTGAIGRAKFVTRKYTNKNGEDRTVNSVDSFIDYDPKYFQADYYPTNEGGNSIPFN